MNPHTRYVLTNKRDEINTEDTKTNLQVLFSTFTFMFKVLKPQHTIAKPISISIECDYLTQSLIMSNTVLKGSVMIIQNTNIIFLHFNIKIFFYSNGSQYPFFFQSLLHFTCVPKLLPISSRVFQKISQKICTHQINCLRLDVTVIYIKIYKFHEMYLWHYLETKRAVVICNSTVSFTKEISPYIY